MLKAVILPTAFERATYHHMNCRFIGIASLLLLAFASVDGFWMIQTFYEDSSCKTASGAYNYLSQAFLDFNTFEQCNSTAGKCNTESAVPLMTSCVTENPLLSAPTYYFTFGFYNDTETCENDAITIYDSVLVAPFNTCIYGPLGYSKISGCGLNQNITVLYYATAQDCANNANPKSLPPFAPNTCTTDDSFIYKLTCPTSQPPVTSSPVAGPGATPSSKKSTAVSTTAVFGLVSSASALFLAVF